MQRFRNIRSSAVVSLAVGLAAALLVALPARFTCAQAANTGQPQAVPPSGLFPNQIGPRETVPVDEYFTQGMALYYAGDFASARNAFTGMGRQGVRSTEGRWIDSICYHTMIGECSYRLGDLSAAAEQYTAALKLYLAYPDWMLRVEFPPTLEPFNGETRKPVSWNAGIRQVASGNVKDKLHTLQGKTEAENMRAIQQGGVVVQQAMYPVRVKEVARCIALAMRRRNELLGPNCEHDPLSQTLVDVVSRRPALPNHWTQTWIELQLGLAYAGMAKPAQAISSLEKSLMAGAVEHHLTCVALVELGKLYFAQGQLDKAAACFLQASVSGGVYGDFDVVEESFRGALATYLVSGRKDLFAPLAPAIAWARDYSMPLTATLLTLSAENFAAMGDPVRAQAMLNDARKVLGRREAMASSIGARLNFEAAKVQFMTGNLAGGNASLTTAMTFQAKGSLRLYQTGIADSLYVQGVVSERTADTLYSDVLREPTPADWRTAPMETLSVVMSRRELAMEHWFDVAIKRKDFEKALEITDQIRRQRFYASLPLGGRTLALRWILAGPPEAIGDEGNLQRRDLLAKYPGFAELSKKAAAIQTQIAADPLAAEDKLYAQLAEVSAAQEVILHEMALKRDASDFVFPPRLVVKDFQKRLPEGTLVLAYYAGSRGLFGFAIARDKYAAWPIATPTKLFGDVEECLRKLGNRDRHQPIERRELQDDSWRLIARRLVKPLTNDAKPATWEQYREVIIVPDGPLWYCPFEALPVGGEGDDTPLLAKTPVRFVPTVALAVPDGRPIKPVARTAVVAGRMYPNENLQVAANAAEQLGTVLPDVVRLPNRLPAVSSLVAKFFDRAVIYHDMDDSDAAPYGWAPLQIDAKSKPASKLGSYLTLPWGSPTQMILPGFHTVAEAGMKKKGNGSELFLTACGLMASGTRTALLTRWRVGGQSCFDLTREFAQELPHAPAAAAWQRSVQLRLQNDLDPATEPRLRQAVTEQPIRPEHPFFWSGYLLIDSGVVPVRPEAQAAK